MSIHEILEHHQKKILTERMSQFEGQGKERSAFDEETTMDVSERYAWQGLQAYWCSRWREAVQNFQTFLKIWPKSVYREDALYLYGDILARHKKECRRVFEEALTRFPESPYMPIARIELGEYFLRVKAHAEAEVAFRKAREALPEKGTLRDYATLRLAETLLARRQDEAGICLLEGLVEESFQFDILREALLLLGRCYFMKGEDKKSFASFSRVRRLWPEKLEQMPPFLFIYAQVALNCGALTQAREAFLKYTEKAADGTIRDIAFICCGDIARHIGKRGAAGRHYKLVNLNNGITGAIAKMRIADLIADTAPTGDRASFLPQSIATFADIAETCRHPLLQQITLWQLASRQIEAGMPLLRSALDTLRRLAVAYPSGRFAEAAREAYARLLPAVARFLLQEGRLAELCVLDAEAEVTWLDPKRRATYLQLLAEGYRRCGAYEEALAVYGRLAAEDALPPALEWRSGRLLLKAGRAKEAVEHFERCHARAGDGQAKRRAAYWLARALCETGDDSRAIPFFREAANRGSEAAYQLGGSYALARAFERLGTLPRAVAAYRDYLEVAKTHGIPWVLATFHHLGDLLYDLEHFEAAAAAYHEAVVSAYLPGRGDWSLYRMAECYRHTHDERQAYQTLMQVTSQSEDERLLHLAHRTLAQLDPSLPLEGEKAQ